MTPDRKKRNVPTGAAITNAFTVLKTYCFEKMPDFYQNGFSLESSFNSAYAQSKLANAKQTSFNSFLIRNKYRNTVFCFTELCFASLLEIIECRLKKMCFFTDY